MSKWKSQLKICNEVIHPGETLSLALRLPELYTCLPAYMPVKVFHGKKPGPCVLVFAAVNGDEVNGTAIINRLTSFKRLKKISGTLIAIPVVNVFGMANKSKFLPGNMDLSTSFPGSKTGTHADRIADLFLTELFEKADYAVSIETGPLNHSYLPEISLDLSIEENRKLAQSFGAPIVKKVDEQPNSLAEIASQRDVNLITYTGGENLRFDTQAIKIGLRGIINLLTYLEMVPNTENKKTKNPETFFIQKSKWVRSSHSGISSNQVKLGAHVKKNTILSLIEDPFGNLSSQQIVSESDGIIIGINNIPLVKEGEALFNLASLAGSDSHLERWNEFMDK